MNETIQRHADTLWHYMQCHEPARSADCLFVLGGRDDRVATYAAHVAAKHTYSLVMISGGVAEHNPQLRSWKESTEAAHFAHIMLQAGYRGRLLLEEAAKNTGENAIYGYKKLQEGEFVMPRSIQFVCKSYMERRAKATFEAQWPDKSTQFYVTSPHNSLHDYVNDEHTLDETVHKMVGDMQRIIEYPAMGFQSMQRVPDEAYRPYEELVEAGFTKYCIQK